MDHNQSMSVYPAADGFIAQFNVVETETKKTNCSDGLEMIVILDRSGSMGQNVRRLVQTVIPQTLTNLGFANDDRIHFCRLFDDSIGWSVLWCNDGPSKNP